MTLAFTRFTHSDNKSRTERVVPLTGVCPLILKRF